MTRGSLSGRCQSFPATARRWADRGPRPTSGSAGGGRKATRAWSNAPAAPPHTASHPPAIEARVCDLRKARKLGPARIGPVLGLPASTVHRILTRHRLNRLAWLDRQTGVVIRRYERDRPGELIHVDVKKLGRIPDGGGHKTNGHKTNGREAGRPIRGMGFDCIHSAVDDHSRLAYSEIHPDEKSRPARPSWPERLLSSTHTASPASNGS